MYRNLTLLLAALAHAALIGGCAGTPDCSDALAQAERAAAERQPLASWIGAVDAACRAPAEAGWADALATDCEPLYAFHAGRTGKAPSGDCRDPAYAEARSLGELLGDMEREQTGIEARLAAETLADDERRRLRQRLIVIERDRPQIAALARMQGYLPPADVPEAAAN